MSVRDENGAGLVERYGSPGRSEPNHRESGAATAGRIEAIEGLRGVLSIIVVIGHINMNFALWFWGCMEIFFAISGYLIGTIAIRHRAASNFWPTYLARRILRIWPLYFTVLASCVVADILSAGSLGESGLTDGWGTLRSLFFVQNTEYYFTTYPIPRYSGNGYPSMFNHSWSVALEEQFYLLAPVLAWLISTWVERNGFSLRRTVLPLLILLCACVAIRAAGVSWWILLGRLDGFVLGIVLAACLSRDDSVAVFRTSYVAKAWFAIITSATIVFMLSYYFPDRYVYGDASPYEWRHYAGVTLFSLFGASLVGFCALTVNHNLLAPLRWPSTQYLGRISYSTYLWHVPIILLFNRSRWYVEEIPRGLHGPFLIAVVVVVATASYRVIELPAMNFKPRFVGEN